MKHLFTTALLGLMSLPAAGADLTVDITGIKAATGTVRIGLYNEAGTFLKPDGLVGRAKMDAVTGGLRHVFEGLAPGQYALSVYQDANGNDKLDKSMFGAPEEPYGMSNDARGSFGPPAFEDAAFTLPESGTAITIKLD